MPPIILYGNRPDPEKDFHELLNLRLYDEHMATVTVPIYMLPSDRDLRLPRYSTPLSSGMYLLAAVTETLPIQPRERVAIPTGVTMGLLPGLEGQIRSLPSMAEKFGVFVPGAPTTIDADYRGELKVVLYNASDKMFIVKRKQKIAQLVVAPVARVVWKEVKDA